MASRDVAELTPRMQIKINALNQRLEEHFPGLFKISCTYRAQAEQDALRLRGRNPLAVVNAAYKKVGLAPITAEENKHKVTWKKISIHTSREAVDYFIQRAGKYCNDVKVDTDGDNIPDWEEFGKMANECGLEWGGTWKKRDLAHVQWRD